jgi:hypothetical protein
VIDSGASDHLIDSGASDHLISGNCCPVIVDGSTALSLAMQDLSLVAVAIRGQ